MGAIHSNAIILGIDLSKIKSIILSHGHYDHTDALSSVLLISPTTSVYASHSIFIDHYSMKTGTTRKIGLSEENKLTLSTMKPDQLHLFSGKTDLLDGKISLLEHIPRIDPLEIPSPLLFSDASSTTADLFPDELVLWFNTTKGLVVLTGCCHAGIRNTCEMVKELAPGFPLYAIIGGFHLAGVSEERLENTAVYFENENISVVIPCHCTGRKETLWLENRLCSRVTKGFCGMKRTFKII